MKLFKSKVTKTILPVMLAASVAVSGFAAASAQAGAPANCWYVTGKYKIASWISGSYVVTEYAQDYSCHYPSKLAGGETITYTYTYVGRL
jgi:hypothetical protein